VTAQKKRQSLPRHFLLARLPPFVSALGCFVYNLDIILIRQRQHNRYTKLLLRAKTVCFV